ncbi:hypothetical protein D3C80_1223000 [compost metagenome]
MGKPEQGERLCLALAAAPLLTGCAVQGKTPVGVLLIQHLMDQRNIPADIQLDRIDLEPERQVNACCFSCSRLRLIREGECKCAYFVAGIESPQQLLRSMPAFKAKRLADPLQMMLQLGCIAPLANAVKKLPFEFVKAVFKQQGGWQYQRGEGSPIGQLQRAAISVSPGDGKGLREAHNRWLVSASARRQARFVALLLMMGAGGL